MKCFIQPRWKICISSKNKWFVYFSQEQSYRATKRQRNTTSWTGFYSKFLRSFTQSAARERDKVFFPAKPIHFIESSSCWNETEQNQWKAVTKIFQCWPNLSVLSRHRFEQNLKKLFFRKWFFLWILNNNLISYDTK